MLFTIALDKDQIVIKRRPADHDRADARPSKDSFRGSIGTVTFIRDATGRVKELSVRQDRVFDLRFQKRP